MFKLIEFIVACMIIAPRHEGLLDPRPPPHNFTPHISIWEGGEMETDDDDIMLLWQYK